APGADPPGVLVVLVDVVRPVAVADVEPAVGGEGDVGGAVLPRLLVNAGLLGRPPLPDHLALEVGLEHLAVLDVAEVEELAGALLADVEAVAAGVDALAEGADEPAGGLEDQDGVLDLGALVPLLLDVDEALRVDRDAVGRLPPEPVGQLAPAVDALVAVLA